MIAPTVGINSPVSNDADTHEDYRCPISIPPKDLLETERAHRPSDGTHFPENNRFFSISIYGPVHARAMSLASLHYS